MPEYVLTGAPVVFVVGRADDDFVRFVERLRFVAGEFDWGCRVEGGDWGEERGGEHPDENVMRVVAVSSPARLIAGVELRVRQRDFGSGEWTRERQVLAEAAYWARLARATLSFELALAERLRAGQKAWTGGDGVPRGALADAASTLGASAERLPAGIFVRAAAGSPPCVSVGGGPWRTLGDDGSVGDEVRE